MGKRKDTAYFQAVVLNSIPTPCLVYDQNGRICFWNQALANCFEGEIPFQKATLLQEAFPELGEKGVQNKLKQAIEGTQTAAMLDFSPTLGPGQFWEVSFFPVEWDETDMAYAGLTFKEKHEKPDHPPQAFNFNLSPLGYETWDAIVVTDSQLDEPGPRIVYVNQAFTNMTGYTREEVLGQTPRILQGPDTDRKVLDRLKSCLKNGQYFEGETWNYKKDGSVFLLHWKIAPMRDPEGNITHYMAIQRDYSNWRKAQEQIRESEERYRKLVDYAPVALLVHKHGIIKYANREAARLLKAKSNIMLIGEDIFQHVHPDFRDTAATRVAYVQEQGVSVNLMDQRFIRKDGQVIDVESLAIPFELEGEHCVQSVLKDVTKQKTLGRLLEETQNIAQVGGWSYYLAEDQLYWNKKIYDLFEVPYDTPIDIPFALSHFSEEQGDQAVLREHLNRLINTGEPFDLELRFHTATGQKMWARALGKPYFEAGKLVKVGGTFQNITGEKEAQLERDRIFNYSLDVILIVSFDGHIKQVNPQTEKLLGWSPEEIQGKHVFEFIHPDDRSHTESLHEEMIQEGTEVKAFENRFYCKDGNHKWLSWHSLPVEDEKMIYAFARDVTAQREYEAHLLYNQTLLEQIFNESVDALFLVCAGNNVIERCNKTAVKLFEAESSEALIGVYGPDLHSQKLSDSQISRLREQLEQERAVREEFEMKTLQGNTFWASVAFKLFELQGELYELISIRDITDRKKAQQGLLEKQEFIEKITEQSPSVINIYDYEQKKLIYTNRSIIESLGYEKHELPAIEKYPQSLCHPDDIEAIKAHHRKNLQLQDGEVNVIEYRVKHKNGHWVWLLDKDTVFKRNERGEITQVMGVIQDTTEQKRVEESLRHNEAFFRQLFQNAPVGIVMIDQHYQVEAVNQGFQEIFGYSAEAIKKQSLNDLIVPREYQEEASLLSEETMKGVTHWKASYRCNKKGEWIPVLIYGVPVFLNEDAPVTIFGIYVDISERKKIEDDLKQRTKELLRSNAELEQFAYVTSHNLRSPVINLKSLTELFDPKSIADQENQYLFEKILKSVNQLDETLNDLVKIVAQKKELSKPKQLLDFDKIFNGVRNSLDRQIEQAGATIQTDFSEAPTIYYIRSFLVSIFQNLLSNALKYRSEKRPLRIHVKTTQEDGFIALRFSDNGIGIDLEQHGDQLFNLYKRFHKQSQGKGIGLYIVKSQVESLGGYVEVDSQVGKGTTFTLYLKDVSMEQANQ